MRLFVPFSLIFLQIIDSGVAFVAHTAAPLRRPVTATAAAVAVLAEITPSDILTLVSNTDRGATASRALQDAVNMWIFDQAEAYRTNRSANASALDDPWLYGNFDVAFVATSKAQAQEGNPAGGRFRGRLGRFLYRNEGLYQHILRDVNGRTLAINYIRGKLFSRLPLSVILRGVATPLPPSERAALTAKYGTPLSAGTVRADFEPPLVTVGEIGLRVGPPSSVVLDTPYVDASVGSVNVVTLSLTSLPPSPASPPPRSLCQVRGRHRAPGRGVSWVDVFVQTDDGRAGRRVEGGLGAATPQGPSPSHQPCPLHPIHAFYDVSRPLA
jgi:hypothetical protein